MRIKTIGPVYELLGVDENALKAMTLTELSNLAFDRGLEIKLKDVKLTEKSLGGVLIKAEVLEHADI